uniref:N(4)-bis(aminopropyl)spermidine synthase n=1 Tax=Caldisericum exile TaxID=693075 RepID=A0A7C4XS68_9BACT
MLNVKICSKEVLMDRMRLQILRAILKEPQEIWTLIPRQDNDIKSMYETVEALKEEGLVEYDGTLVKITPKGAELLKKEKVMPFVDTKCPYCKGKLHNPEVFGDLLEKFRGIFKERPRETTEFDQGVVSEENSIRRLEFVYERGDVEGKAVFFLGDDDLTSIVFALSRMPSFVSVVDIDKRIVDYINRVAKALHLPVEAYEYDACRKLDSKFVEKFDTFLTDPVETVKGMRLFLSRCALTLKGKGSAGYFGLSHLESSLSKWYEIEKDLLSMNFVLTDMLRDFNEYLLVGERILHEGYYAVLRSPVKVNPPQIPWYKSTFIRLELIDKAHPLIIDDVVWDRSLYFDDETFVVRP